MGSPKKNPAKQYKTKFALHNVPVRLISQYWTMSKPKGLKKRAIIIERVARFPTSTFLQVCTVTVHSLFFFHGWSHQFRGRVFGLQFYLFTILAPDLIDQARNENFWVESLPPGNTHIPCTARKFRWSARMRGKLTFCVASRFPTQKPYLGFWSELLVWS